MNALLLSLALLSASAEGADGAAASDAPAVDLSTIDVAELRVLPEAVSLTTERDRQRVVVQAIRPDGLTHDVSAAAKWTLADPKLAAIEGDTLRPTADGQTTLTVAFGGKSVAVPVVVAQATQPRDIRFKLDVMPVFAKAGCNSGSCHGAARGKDGFNLSLFGFDPDGDYGRITREQVGRRIDLAVPEASLLVEKAIGAVPHTGGKCLEADSPLTQDLIAWIAKGAPRDPDDQAECVGIALHPPQAVLEGQGAAQPMTVVASYSDGSTRDVTALAYFNSSNAGVADVDGEGILRAGERGEAFVLARFDKFSVGSQVLTLPSELAFEQDFGQVSNAIDEDVKAKLAKLRINPSPIAGDEEFLRRITIDLTGQLPTFEEYEAFLADGSPDKRARKIDELIATPEFTDIWVANWSELLMMRVNQQLRVSYKSVVLYNNWLREKIAGDVPFDEIVTDLLVSEGGSFSSPATNFYELETDPLKVAENTAQLFMGMRIQCAQCHNHPFDRWTQDDYYGFAAFFSQIGRKNSEDYRERVIYDRRGGEVKHVVTGQNAPPTYLGDGAAETRGKDRRAVLAEWLTDPENPFFAANIANRTWAHFFGIGIVDPVDDVRISNPASNPELLDGLAKRFAESGYDFKGMVREICNSATYQRTSLRNDSNRMDEMNFAHQTVRRIKAEPMLDILSQVTQTEDDFRGLPRGARAVQIADGNTSTYFLTTFGRAKRETVCACEVKMEPTLSQALHLLNGDSTGQKIAEGGAVPSMIASGLTDEQIIERLYVRCFTRRPTDQERSSLLMSVAEAVAEAGGNDEAGGDTPENAEKRAAARKRELEDIFWALLNSREMLFNS